MDKRFSPNKDYVSKRFSVMDKVRQDLQDEWERSYNQIVGQIDRIGERGDELNQVNINTSYSTSMLITRFMCKTFFYKKDFGTLLPRAGDDVEATQIMKKYLEYQISEMPAIEELGYKWLLQAVVKGFSPAKFMPVVKNNVLQGMKFIPTNVNDMWLDPVWAVGLIRDLFFEVRLTESEMEDLKEDKNYNKDEINRMLSENPAPQGKEPREEDLAKEDRSIPTEAHEKEWTIREYWYQAKGADGEDIWLLQVWGVKNNSLEYLIRDEEEPIYWFGHPFVFGLVNPKLYENCGWGEPVILRDYHNAINRILNQKLDYNDIASNPPVLISRSAFSEDSQLDALANPVLGGLVVMDRIGPSYIDWFRLPTVAPESGELIGYLSEAKENASIRERYLSGVGSLRREPATTTLTNRQQALESIEFKNWVIGWAFKDLLKKMLICVQQYKPKEEITRVVGRRGYLFLKQGTERQTKEAPLLEALTEKLSPNLAERYEEATINLKAGAKEALKFYDIRVETISSEPPEILARRGLEAIGLFSKVPPLAERADWIQLGREVLDAWGFPNVNELLPPVDELSPEISRLLSKIPNIEKILLTMLTKMGILKPPEQKGGGQPGAEPSLAGEGVVGEEANLMREAMPGGAI